MSKIYHIHKIHTKNWLLIIFALFAVLYILLHYHVSRLNADHSDTEIRSGDKIRSFQKFGKVHKQNHPWFGNQLHDTRLEQSEMRHPKNIRSKNILKKRQKMDRNVKTSRTRIKIGGQNEWIIGVWENDKRFNKRFLRSYGRKDKDPFQFCSVRNCKVYTDRSSYKVADAVFINMHRIRGPSDLPPLRYPDQIYIMFTDESPLNTFYVARKSKISDYNDIFNWTMTYGRDSDIPTPFGRTVELTAKEKANVPKVAFWKKKTKLAAIISSNCSPQPRKRYVNELKKHMKVDFYGKCGELKCKGSAYSTKDCTELHKYKFYLAFENSPCEEYITEKVWWNAFMHDAIPVVLGGTKSSYERLLPPKSFIHVEDYESPKHLATYLTELGSNETAGKEYFRWRKTHKIVNEHGYYGTPSLHICRICEALNLKKNKIKTYPRLDKFWNKRLSCRSSRRMKGLKPK